MSKTAKRQTTSRQDTVEFTHDPTARRLISAIAHRAVALAGTNGIKLKLMDVEMDVNATHTNGCPLRLADLLKADDFNFLHDVFGIRRHLDRDTGELRNCFLPRCARPQRV